MQTAEQFVDELYRQSESSKHEKTDSCCLYAIEFRSLHALVNVVLSAFRLVGYENIYIKFPSGGYNDAREVCSLLTRWYIKNGVGAKHSTVGRGQGLFDRVELENGRSVFTIIELSDKTG